MDFELLIPDRGLIRTIFLKILVCPICKELMYPPIRECISGHNFCDSCFEEITVCALCREPKASGRNFGLEEICKAMIVRCKNRRAGCDYQGIFSIVGDHEVMCPFSKVLCIMSYDCDRRELRLLSQIGHCQTFHPENMIKSNVMNLIHLNFLNLYSTFLQKRGMTFGPQTVLHYKYWLIRPFCHIDSEDISWHIAYQGPQCFPEMCWFNLKLITPDKKKLPLIMHKRCRPYPIELGYFHKFEHKIRHSSLRPFCRDGNLHYSLEIYVETWRGHLYFT